MAAWGEELTAETHLENLSSWRPPPAQASGGTATSSPAPSTAASDFEHDGILLSSGKALSDGEKQEKEGGACSKSRVAWISCILVCLVALGLGLALGLRDDDSSGDAAGSNSQIQECGNSNGQPCCNGLESNCNVRVNEMVFPATHNSMSAAENGFVAANHFRPLEESLDAGYRALFMDLCNCADDKLLLCHGACKAGTRDPEIVFQNIFDFLNDNPTEVLLIELQVGEPKELLSDLYGIMVQIGLTNLMYSHPDRSTPWPLMGELVQNNTRLIMFQHDGPNCFRDECPPGVHNTFGYMFETSFEFRGLEDISDYDNSCMVTRGDTRNDFFILNHYSSNRFGLPSAEFAAALNEQSALEERIAACTERVGKVPNLLVVDFWGEGDVPKVAQLQSAGGTSTTTSVPSVAPTTTATATASPGVTESPSISPQTTTQPSIESQTVAPSVAATDLQTQSPSTTGTAPPTVTPTLGSTPLPTTSPTITVVTPPPSPETTVSPLACNGLESNCNLPVNSLMFATVNNAMSSDQDGFTNPNNFLSLEGALEAGYRGIMLDSCSCSGIALCADVCDATRDPVQVFQSIVTFLNQNRREVVIVELEINADTLFDLFASLSTIDGLTNLTYTPGLGGDWPLMIELIEQNKRLIIFQRDGADCNVEPCPNGVLNTDTYMFQTPAEIQDVGTLLDYDTSCVVARGTSDADFFISNHFVVPPDSQGAEQVNNLSNLQARMDACFSRLRRYPNLLAVNYWSVGDVLDYVESYNSGLTTPATDPPATDPPVTEPPATDPPTTPPTASPPTGDEPPLDPIVVDENWFQCSGEPDCSNGYDSSKDCFGIDGNCPGEETCDISCSFIGTQYCYFAETDDCSVPAVQCNTAPCPNGVLCVNEFSFECGRRVCKNSTITEDFRACDLSSECRDDTDCPGDELVCASFYNDCGIGV